MPTLLACFNFDTLYWTPDCGSELVAAEFLQWVSTTVLHAPYKSFYQEEKFLSSLYCCVHQSVTSYSVQVELWSEMCQHSDIASQYKTELIEQTLRHRNTLCGRIIVQTLRHRNTLCGRVIVQTLRHRNTLCGRVIAQTLRHRNTLCGRVIVQTLRHRNTL